MKKLYLLLLLIFGVFCFSLQCYGTIFEKSRKSDFGSRCKTIDSKIVEAFNTSPPRTKEVYYYCNELIDKARNRSSRKNQEWVDKAKKLITLACFNEVNDSISSGDIRDAYMWSERGITKGASRGRIADYDIGEFYTQLEELKILIKEQMDQDGISYSNTRLRVDVNNTSLAKTTSERFNWQGKKRKKLQEHKSYTYIKGPFNDNDNNIYVMVKTTIKGTVRIQFYKNKGWGISALGNEIPTKFYNSWQQCAADL